MLLYYLTLFIIFEGLILLWNHYFVYCLCSPTECKGHQRMSLVYLVHCYVLII